jgi:cystathionine beta-lyase/cystathionine gamma-synthase
MLMLNDAIADIHEDLDETLYLVGDNIRRLKTFLGDLKKVKRHIDRATYEHTRIEAEQYIDTFSQYKERIWAGLSSISALAPSDTLLSETETIVEETRSFLRSYQCRVGALITSTDWQSPTFAHSLRSQAGRQTNTIYATINDYKRDQHWDTYRYERAFLKEYIDAFIKFPIQVWTTSSGMAAFTTILNFLLFEHSDDKPVLTGRSIYFENKALVKSAYGARVIEVEENDTKSVIAAIQTHNPSVIIFDSLTNAPSIPLPDLPAIIRFLTKHVREDTYLVIDNTCLSVTFQPIPLLRGLPSKLHLIVFESLNKYYQFGMDRVTGGILWSAGGNTEKLFDYRIHLGTIMPDVTTASLPTPNRKLLTARLRRHERNASLLSSAMQEWIDTHPKSPLSQIVYPGLPNHPAGGGQMPFHGSYFIIGFKKKYQTIPSYKRFVSTVIDQAKRSRVDIVSGTSFGLNRTRIYLTAVRSKPATPFVRVAVGTEHRIAIEHVIQVCIRACTRFR